MPPSGRVLVCERDIEPESLGKVAHGVELLDRQRKSKVGFDFRIIEGFDCRIGCTPDGFRILWGCWQLSDAITQRDRQRKCWRSAKIFKPDAADDGVGGYQTVIDRASIWTMCGRQIVHAENFWANLAASNDGQLESQSGFSDLAGGRDGFSQKLRLVTKNEQLEKPDSGENAGKFYNPPIGIRFIGLLLCFALGFFGIIWGWKDFDDDRRVFGAALIGGSGLLAVIGLIL